MTAPRRPGDSVAGSGPPDLSERHKALETEMRARDDRLAHLAHKMRTPLTSIRSSAQILIDYGTEDPAATAEFLTIIRDASETLARVIEEDLEAEMLRGEGSS